MRADDNDRRVPLSAIARRYRHFLLDLDGCLWVGDDAPRSAPPRRVAALREAGKGIVFLTNDVRQQPRGDRAQAVAARLPGLARRGDDAPAPRCSSCSPTAPGGGAAYVIGSQALVDHVAEAGLRIVNNTEFATRADVVVVADHERFDYDELQDRHPGRAARRRADRRHAATRTFPMPDGLWPGSGAVLAAVETAGRPQGRRRSSASPSRHVRGGPRPARRGQRSSRVGDRLDADVLGAKRAGLDSALVLTGATDARAGRRRHSPPPPTSPTRSRRCC